MLTWLCLELGLVLTCAGTSTSHQQVPVHLPQVPANAGGATLPVASPQQQPSTVESNNATIAGGALSAATSYSAVAQVPGSCTLDSTPRQVASPLNQQQQQQVGAALAGYDSSSSGRAMGPHVPLVYAEHALGISSSYANHVSASAAGPSTGALGTGQVLSAAAAAEGAAAAFGPGRAVVEAAARRTALRDVLSAILGDVGPKLDHYRLDVQVGRGIPCAIDGAGHTLQLLLLANGKGLVKGPL